jgi:hypothetical protein
MKKFGLVGLILCALVFSAVAQQATHKTSRVKKTSVARKPAGRNTNRNVNNSGNATTYSMVSTSSNAAKSSTTGLTIADPVTLDLKQRAMNLDNQPPGFAIPGMPRRIYGLANGHLFLRSTDAVSNGTTTGSGSVGTGTSLGSVGTSGHGLTVNGKNPYAGAEIYGIPGFAPPRNRVAGQPPRHQ